MMKKMTMILSILLVSAAMFNCGDMLSGGMLTNSPNIAMQVSMDQSFNAVQAQQFLNFTGHLDRGLNIWLERTCGTSRQYSILTEYTHDENEFNGEFNSFYTGGGLIDVRGIIAQAQETGDKTHEGIAKVWEAYMMGTAASLWGNIPYSEAVSDVAHPVFDDQRTVYTAIDALLSSAISDLASPGFGPQDVDVVYGGDPAQWTKLAYALKARFAMHWAAVDGSTSWNAVLSAVGSSFASTADTYATVHTAAAGEQNMFYQYEDGRAGYMSAGFYLTNLLTTRTDPRADLYYDEAASGVVEGYKPGEAVSDKSNINGDTFRSMAWGIDLVSYEEVMFLKAEAQYKTGDEAGARTTVNSVLDAIEARWDFAAGSIDRTAVDGTTGEDFFEEVMLQKYMALFLNFESYNDYKRTGYPDDLLGPGINGKVMPRRPYYSDGERQVNTNTPTVEQQQQNPRNANDPTSSSHYN